jgi:hypothetical protein
MIHDYLGNSIGDARLARNRIANQKSPARATPQQLNLLETVYPKTLARSIVTG